MATTPIAIIAVGLMTSVGLAAASSCAAMRCGLSNTVETELVQGIPEALCVHRVPLSKPWQGIARLIQMGSQAGNEALAGVSRSDFARIHLILCFSELERPGREPGLDARLRDGIQARLQGTFASSTIIAQGRVGVAMALRAARVLVEQGGQASVLVVAVDSLLCAKTLAHYSECGRLLDAFNSNGFLPGEAAGALLLGAASGDVQTLCTGVGFGLEEANLYSTLPLRGAGLTMAIREALAESKCQIHDMDYRIADIAGEQYGFKQDNLGVVRLLREHKSEFDLWHPAESIGETGAAAGAVMLAVACAANRKRYAPGPRALLHLGNDGGLRAAIILRYGVV